MIVLSVVTVAVTSAGSLVGVWGEIGGEIWARGTESFNRGAGRRR